MRTKIALVFWIPLVFLMGAMCVNVGKTYPGYTADWTYPTFIFVMLSFSWLLGFAAGTEDK